MTRYDRYLILLLLTGAIGLYIFRLLPVSGETLQARIEIGGRTVQTVDLARQNGQTVKIGLAGGEAYLEVKDGAVRIRPMPEWLCPRQICSHTGWIRRAGESLVCVPNRLVVRLTGSQASEVDAITR